MAKLLSHARCNNDSMSRVEANNRATVLHPNDLQTLGWPRRKNKPGAQKTVRDAPEQLVPSEDTMTTEVEVQQLQQHWKKQGVREGLPFCFPVVPPTFDWETYRRINFSTEEEREPIDRPEKAWLHWLRVGRHGKAFACNNAAGKKESSSGENGNAGLALSKCCPGATEITFAALALVTRVVTNDGIMDALDRLTELQKRNPALQVNEVVSTYLNACGYSIGE
jgi:hypothetical protein